MEASGTTLIQLYHIFKQYYRLLSISINVIKNSWTNSKSVRFATTLFTISKRDVKAILRFYIF